MSQFKSKYDQMQENNPTETGDEIPPLLTGKEARYPTHAYARNVSFVFRDGSRIFLNYSYMISGEYLSASNTLILTFTTHILTLTGQNLEPLYYQFMQHIPQQIISIENRYNVLSDENSPVVNEIKIEVKE